MEKGKIAIIVEGAVREPMIFRNINREFFTFTEIEIVTLSANQNIYMLSQRLKKDDFDTDIIEVIREYDDCMRRKLDGYSRRSFQEIYLFFDFDAHTNNLNKQINMMEQLEEMINIFDNETENGKLYISYPMIEALRDIPTNKMACFQRCVLKNEECSTYKKNSSYNMRFNQFNKYEKKYWNSILQYYLFRLNCLFPDQNIKTIEDVKSLTTFDIYRQQFECFFNRELVFILSGIPQFILDYFESSFLNEYISNVEVMS